MKTQDKLPNYTRKIFVGGEWKDGKGPAIKDMAIINQQAVLSFTHVGSGLTFKGEQLKGFAIAGNDGKFIWANAKIDNNKVVVWHEQIKEPVKVRYAWEDNPAKATLMNKEGLPASSFEIVISD